MTTAARLGRPGALTLVVLTAALFAAGVAFAVSSSAPEPALATLPPGWTAASLTQAAGAVPITWVRGYFLLLQLLPATAGLIACVLVLRGADSWFRCYTAVALALFGTMSGAIPAVLDHGVGGATGDALGLLVGVAWVGLFPLAYLFPDGRAVPSWTRWCIVAWGLVIPYTGLAEVLGWGGPDDPAQTLPLLALFGTAAYAAVHRYRRVSTVVQRAQTRGVVAALLLWFFFLVVLALTPLGSLRDDHTSRGLIAGAVSVGISYGVVTLIPVAVTVGVLRHRLYEVDIWVNRALVYATLTGVVGLAYAMVTLLGTWWWRDNELVGPMVLAVLLGVAFQPLRKRVQRSVDRFVYGRRKEPYAVLTDLGRQLSTVRPPDEVLKTLVRQVCVALNLPYAAVTLSDSDLTVSWPANTPVPQRGSRETFALAWQGQELGQLLAVTSPGDDLGPGDRDLLDELARHAGSAVRAARLNDDLRRSRVRILGTREDERRRLQRDLHDGLMPTLASLYQRVEVARTVLTEDPVEADRILAEVGERSKGMVSEMRALVRGLRPPELELGLASALQNHVHNLNGLTVSVSADDLPAIPPAIETAAYRIALEGLTNAARHSRGTRATVDLTVSDDALRIRVADNGQGLPEGFAAGTGVLSMRERADEVGGTFDLSGPPGGGTRVTATLPLDGGER